MTINAILSVLFFGWTTFSAQALFQSRSPTTVDKLRSTFDKCASLNFFPHTLRIPQGMTTPLDLCILYRLALITPGPILEQGCFVGRSTTAIAWALRERWAKSRQKTLFITNDIFPASHRAVDNHVYPATKVPYYWKTSKSKGREYVDEFTDKGYELSLKKKTFSNAFRNYLDVPGGQLHVLYANLNENKLMPYVTITAGRTIPILPYSFVWSDASHTTEEISINKPGWLKICRESTRDVVFAFHDRLNVEDMKEIDDIFLSEGFEIVDKFHGRFSESTTSGFTRFQRFLKDTSIYVVEIACRGK